MIWSHMSTIISILPSQTAEITAQAAINELFARFGYPFQIFTDHGRHFESALFKAVCDLLKIHKARITPYRPSANGQVERQNKSLMTAVRWLVDSSQENWDEHLPQLAGAMRSCINRSTGFTPNMFILCREIHALRRS
jgi:transposase InsO family protein